MAEKPSAKVIGYVSLGALFGPGSPDPDLGHAEIKVRTWKSCDSL